MTPPTRPDDFAGEDTIEALIDRAEDTPDGPEKVALLREAAARADGANRPDLAFRARLDLVEAASHAGDPAVMLAAFAWCLNHDDGEGGGAFRAPLLWMYKWVLAAVLGTPQVPLERVRALQADFARRAREADLGERAAEHARLKLALHLGDAGEAARVFARWTAARPGRLDCRACDAQTRVVYRLLLGDAERALAEAAPIRAGKRRCNRVPGRTSGTLLAPLLALGRADEASELQRSGYPLVRPAEDMLDTHAEHVDFLTASGGAGQALDLYRRHSGFAARTGDLASRLRFDLAASRLWHRLAREGGDTTEARLAPRRLGDAANGRVDAAGARDAHLARARDAAGRFDARGGVTRFTALVDGALADGAFVAGALG